MATKKDPLADEFAPAGYKLPSNSSYMKFTQGKNKFRFLSSLVTGYEYWNTDNKPVRSREEPTDTSDGKEEEDGKVRVNHFWAAVVYNYQTEAIETLQITQKGIMKYITGLLNDPEWGSPKNYDIVVTREGEGLGTKYTVAANPHKELDPAIKEAYEDCGIDLNALFEN